MTMAIRKRREEREEILFLKMSIGTEIRTVKILEEKTDHSPEKRTENTRALGAMKIGVRMVPGGDGEHPAGALSSPESQRNTRTGGEGSLQQSKKSNSPKLHKLNMPYIQLKQIIFYID